MIVKEKYSLQYIPSHFPITWLQKLYSQPEVSSSDIELKDYDGLRSRPPARTSASVMGISCIFRVVT
jgi:hypothetical protein